MGKQYKTRRPHWYYLETPLANIKALEADGQPWAIARYRMGGRFVDGESEVVYELVIFQSYNNEDSYDTLIMTRAQFVEAMTGLGLAIEPRYTSMFGAVFGRDDKLRDIVNEYNAMRDKARVEENRLHGIYISCANRISNGKRDEKTMKALAESRAAYRSLFRQNRAKAEAFIKGHNILQYNF